MTAPNERSRFFPDSPANPEVKKISPPEPSPLAVPPLTLIDPTLMFLSDETMTEPPELLSEESLICPVCVTDRPDNNILAASAANPWAEALTLPFTLTSECHSNTLI